jgi:hypothetical protein
MDWGKKAAAPMGTTKWPTPTSCREKKFTKRKKKMTTKKRTMMREGAQ